MGSTGDGLKALSGLGLGYCPVEQSTNGPPAQVVVYVRDLEGGRDLVGLRRSGVHAYEYQLAPPEGAGDSDQK
jgi:hypothetical protein